MIKCFRCSVSKPAADFQVDKTKRNGRASYCRVCYREYKREWYARNPEKSAGYVRKLKYGTTGAELQQKQCAICNDPLKREKHLDHCHATGKVRAWLCRCCNLGLGRFKDNPARLRAAADYLEKHR